jgi:predicted O-methyltransferase YrrM
MLAMSQPGSPDRLLKPGAIIIGDNVLRRAHVVDESLKESMAADWPDWPAQEREEQVAALREFNELVKAEQRLENFVVPLWDGASLIRLVD